MTNKSTKDIIADKADDRTGHPYFMYDSIHKIAEYVDKCWDERIIGEIETVADLLVERNIKRIIVVGCGTPQYTAISNRIIWKNMNTGIEIVHDDGLDLLHYNYLYIDKSDAILGISHSGGTKATEDFLRHYTEKGITTICITDNKGSRVDNASEITIVGPGGVDRSIPKTRSYVTHSYLFTILGGKIAERKGQTIDWETIKSIPSKIDETDKNVEEIMKAAAKEYKDLNKCILVGSGVNYATVMEGALKVIEASLIPTLYCQVEEAAHGYDLPLDNTFFAMVLVPHDMKLKFRAEHIIKGIKQTGAKLTILCTNKEDVADVAEGATVVELGGQLPEEYSLFNFIVPIYYLAYFITVEKGLNPDKSSSIKPEFKLAFMDFLPEGYH